MSDVPAILRGVSGTLFFSSLMDVDLLSLDFADGGVGVCHWVSLRLGTRLVGETRVLDVKFARRR